MPSRRRHRPIAKVRVRAARLGDLDALMVLEQRVFDTDQLSRRSLRHFVRASTAWVVVAQEGGRLAGTAIVLFRPRSAVARLYSIAVAPHLGGRGVAQRLLAAAERSARGHGCACMRLEVHETNHAAISRYRKSGYLQFGRHEGYYEDGGAALRFEKPLTRRAGSTRLRPSRK